METKKKIRQEILACRDAISPVERKRQSDMIREKIKELPGFTSAEQLLLFVSYGSEPDTQELIMESLKKGKAVYCPVVFGETMEFYRIHSLKDLQEGYKGILEPVPSEEKKFIPGKHDFMLLPGTVFDRAGNRIGYGKGFYDKYLSSGFAGETAAVAFSIQIVENGRIPAEDTDHKMNCIVTDKEIIRI